MPTVGIDHRFDLDTASAGARPAPARHVGASRVLASATRHPRHERAQEQSQFERGTSLRRELAGVVEHVVQVGDPGVRRHLCAGSSRLPGFGSTTGDHWAGGASSVSCGSSLIRVIHAPCQALPCRVGRPSYPERPKSRTFTPIQPTTQPTRTPATPLCIPPMTAPTAVPSASTMRSAGSCFHRAWRGSDTGALGATQATRLLPHLPQAGWASGHAIWHREQNLVIRSCAA